jgi:hypothetical protein
LIATNCYTIELNVPHMCKLKITNLAEP